MLRVQVYFTNEETDSTFSFNHGKETANEPYVKIKTKKGTVGWVYGLEFITLRRKGVGCWSEAANREPSKLFIFVELLSIPQLKPWMRIFKKNCLIFALSKKHKVKAAYLIGSVLTDKFNSFSDIDLLIYLQEVPFTGHFENFFSLEESLTKLLNRKVNLVPGRTLSNPYFISSVNRNKFPLYE